MPEEGLAEPLARVRRREADAGESLPRLYGELRALAGSYLRGHASAQTLQPTALVHELFLKLVATPSPDWKDRAHFIAVAATAMRQILIDHLRKTRAEKRGGSRQRVTLEGMAIAAPEAAVDVLELSEVLDRLAALDARAARLVELRFFGGLTEDEAAEVLGVSLRTVQKEWRKARAWLAHELGSVAGE